MNLVAMETESSQFNTGNKLVLVAGLSCIIAGIVKLVQCGRQNQDDGNSENATAHGYERARICSGKYGILASNSTTYLTSNHCHYLRNLIHHVSNHCCKFHQWIRSRIKSFHTLNRRLRKDKEPYLLILFVYVHTYQDSIKKFTKKN